MKIEDAKLALDNLISKARVHLYKPIQIAEILYRDRVENDISLSKLETYRTYSKKWRDIICLRFLGRTSTSSARYQDDIFNENAIPPKVLTVLGKFNRENNGIIETYIYKCFEKRFTQMSLGVNYCLTHTKNDFKIDEFVDLFWNEPGLKRSIDKIYEIIVYSLFSALVEALKIKISITADKSQNLILKDFESFTKKVIGISSTNTQIILDAKINRVGVTNAADRGLDMWANFGMAIQIKHLTLTEELAENIVSSITSDRIVIVCKDAEKKLILSLLTQIGWKSKIQSIITEKDLFDWYKKALKGKYSDVLGDRVLDYLKNEISLEFPVTDKSDLKRFKSERGYKDSSLKGIWKVL